MKEIRSHTALRGIASVGVVIYHYSLGLEWHHFISKSHALVDMFFILSGFIIAAVYSSHLMPGNKDGYKSFYISRFARIYPLYIASTLSMVAFLVLAGREIQPGAVTHFVFTVFGVQAWGLSDQFYFNGPSWSISAEFAAYLSFPILAAYWRSRLSIPFLLLIITLIYIALVSNYGTLNIEERLAWVRGVVGFSLGMIIYHYRKHFDKLKYLSTYQLVTVVFLFSVFYFNVSEFFLIPSFAALIGLTWSDSGLVPKMLSNRILHALGVWSFGIYLLHMPVAIAFGYLWPHLPVVDTQNKELFILTALAITIVSAFLSYEYFENPVRRFIRNYSYRKNKENLSQSSLTSE